MNAAQPSGCGSPSFQPADEKFQVDGLFRVGVGDLFKQFADGDLDAQFLAQFADQALLEGFVRLAFAAGKFPKPAQMRIRVALGDEQFAVAENQRGGNVDALGFDC